MQRVLVIAGATGVGKSALALRIAERLGCASISADSRQVYRGLRIGTAQPSAAERARVTHELVDFLPLDKRYSAQQFADDSRSRLDGIRRANQGVFVILARDRAPGVEEAAQRFKTVRVVSTVEYYLRD